MITVVTKAKDFLIPLMDVKAHIRVDAAFDDHYIFTLLRQAQDFAEKITGRPLGVHTFEFTHSEDDELYGLEQQWNTREDRIHLRKGPITELVSLTTYDKEDAATVLTLSDYTFINDDQYSIIIKKDGNSIPRGTRLYNDLVVRFKAGYNEESLPDGLRGALLQLIGFWYEMRDGLSESSITEPPYSIKNLLQPYRYEVI